MVRRATDPKPRHTCAAAGTYTVTLTARGARQATVVRILAPFSVMATVCSKWAEREPSCVTTVQRSPSVPHLVQDPAATPAP